MPSRDFTDEEIALYFGGDRIECLLCGKTYRSLGVHLQVIHGTSEDEYRFRYGLPLSAGLVSAESRAAYAARAAMVGHDAEWMRSIRELQTTPMPPARMSAVKRRRTEENRKKATQHPRLFNDDDVRRVIAAMRDGDLTLREAVTAGEDTPHLTVVLARIRQSQTLRVEYERTRETLSFAAQARSQRMGQRFAEAVVALRAEGRRSDHEIARLLGVTAMTVNRTRRRLAAEGAQ